MKNYLFLLLMIPFLGFSQITQAEFDKSMELLSGRDQQAAIANLSAMEKKYPETVEVIYLRSIYQFRDGDNNSAMMGFSNAIKKDPQCAMAYSGRAELFSVKGMSDKAISDISKAITLEPKNAELVIKRAGMYYRSEQYGLGLEDMKTVIRLKPNEMMGYYDAAVFSKKADPNFNSDDFFTQAYANKGIQKFVTDVLYGKFLIGQGRFEEAKTKYESALSTSEKDFDAEDLHDAAIAFYKTKNYDKAIIYFNKAIGLFPENLDYRNNLASVYLDQKDWGKMKETSQLALEQDSNNPMANMFMAVALSNTGNQTLADQYQAKAKKLDAEQNK